MHGPCAGPLPTPVPTQSSVYVSFCECRVALITCQGVHYHHPTGLTGPCAAPWRLASAETLAPTSADQVATYTDRMIDSCGPRIPRIGRLCKRRATWFAGQRSAIRTRARRAAPCGAAHLADASAHQTPRTRCARQMWRRRGAPRHCERSFSANRTVTRPATVHRVYERPTSWRSCIMYWQMPST